MEVVNPHDSKILAIYIMLTIISQERSENTKQITGKLKRKAYCSHLLKDYYAVESDLRVSNSELLR